MRGEMHLVGVFLARQGEVSCTVARARASTSSSCTNSSSSSCSSGISGSSSANVGGHISRRQGWGWGWLRRHDSPSGGWIRVEGL